jgi:hypothetical protein
MTSALFSFFVLLSKAEGSRDEGGDDEDDDDDEEKTTKGDEDDVKGFQPS